ncbi:arylamine N-acetyltransferase domain protein, partial [Vibrio harveyi]
TMLSIVVCLLRTLILRLGVAFQLLNKTLLTN